jgi:uncharacterized membrane protein
MYDSDRPQRLVGRNETLAVLSFDVPIRENGRADIQGKQAHALSVTQQRLNSIPMFVFLRRPRVETVEVLLIICVGQFSEIQFAYAQINATFSFIAHLALSMSLKAATRAKKLISLLTSSNQWIF